MASHNSFTTKDRQPLITDTIRKGILAQITWLTGVSLRISGDINDSTAPLREHSRPQKVNPGVHMSVSVTWLEVKIHIKIWKSHVQCLMYSTEISYWRQIQIQHEKLSKDTPAFVTVTFLLHYVRRKQYLTKIK